VNCPKCGRPVIEATLPNGQKQLFNAEPNTTDAQTLVIAGNAIYLDGKTIGEARRNGLPVHARHGLTCPNYWQSED
jgi:UDP-N-acetylmuramate-alanine ligase